MKSATTLCAQLLPIYHIFCRTSVIINNTFFLLDIMIHFASSLALLPFKLLNGLKWPLEGSVSDKEYLLYFEMLTLINQIKCKIKI